jgi:hypothetical protein
VSVDATHGTFVANASVVTPQAGGGHDASDNPTSAPATTQVTITTDANTEIKVNDEDAKVADLAPGQTFEAKFSGSPSDPITTLVQKPALALFAEAPPTPHAAVAGTIVSVDATHGTFVANAFVVPAETGNEEQQDGSFGSGEGSGFGSSGGSGSGGHGDASDLGGATPTTTQVTITTDANTKIQVNEQDSTVAGLAAGQKFYALFKGATTDPITTLVQNPALAVFARTAPKPHQLYAFVGTVTAVDTTAGTVTVNVSRSLPSSLVPTGSPPVTFTVGPDTLVLGGSSAALFGATLADVSVGDIVAGGLIGDGGLTLTQVQATPLRVLLDLPATSTPSTGVQAARDKALRKALALLGDKRSAKSKHHHASGKKHHSHKRSKKR